MAITKNPDRQWPLRAKVTFTQADVPTGVDTDMIDLPGGARVIGGQVGIVTPGDSVTSDTITVGDGTTANRYGAAIDGQAAGVSALTPDELAHATGKGVVTLTNTQVGGEGTAMVGFLEVEYVIEGRGNESQPV